MQNGNIILIGVDIYGRSIKKRKKIYTYSDYATWPDEERWEIIEGEPYDMSPAPTLNHQRYLRRLLTKFENYLEGKTCEVFNSPCDVLLPEEGENMDSTTNIMPDFLQIIISLDRNFISSYNHIII